MTPVAFVHGFMGGSAQWQAQVQALEGSEVICVDLPGFGANAGSEALGSIPAIANWVLETLLGQGVQQFDLIGHSMGGMIAQEMVAQAQASVERLVLYGTGATGLLPGRFETIETSKSRALADGAQATAHRIAATWFLQGDAAAGYADCAAIAERAGLAAILKGLDAMEGWTGEQNLSAIKAKTLIICGDRDRTYSWAQTEKLWQTIPDASLAVMPGCAHAAHLEKPEIFNSLLADFLTCDR